VELTGRRCDIYIYITSQKKTPTREGEGFYASLVRTTGADY